METQNILDELNAIAHAINQDTPPYGFAGAAETIAQLKSLDEFKNPSGVMSPVFVHLSHPERFGIEDDKLMPLHSQDEARAVAAIDQVMAENLDPTMARQMVEAMIARYEEERSPLPL